jgi:hypothetical protein
MANILPSIVSSPVRYSIITFPKLLSLVLSLLLILLLLVGFLFFHSLILTAAQ